MATLNKMKTAEEWEKEYLCAAMVDAQDLRVWFKQIQLDAWKQGRDDALAAIPLQLLIDKLAELKPKI